MDGAIWTLGESCQRNFAVDSAYGALEKLVGEASSAANEQGYRSLLGAVNITVAHREALLVAHYVFHVAPPNRERVGHPPPD